VNLLVPCKGKGKGKGGEIPTCNLNHKGSTSVAQAMLLLECVTDWERSVT
jgi:hypothetical protein